MKNIEDYEFNITYDFYNNCVYVKPLNNKHDRVLVDIKNQNKFSIYSQNIDVHKNFTYWFKLNTPFTDFSYIYVEISNDNGIIKTEGIKIKTNSGILIKQPVLNIVNKVGLGDVMLLSPTIKKLYEIYGRKIIITSSKNNHDKYIVDEGWGQYIYNSYNEFFKNNPYYNYSVYLEDILEPEKYDILNIYDNNHDYIWVDQKRYLSIPLNFSLKENELSMIYVPDEYVPIENLPEKYICINPHITGIERSWEKEKWQELVNLLNDNGIYVVSIGKDRFHKLDIKLGVELTSFDHNMSQTWHIINRSDIFVTFDCSMFILSETTDTHILLMGWSHDQNIHKPINREKYSYVLGNCDKACANDINYIFEKYGSIKDNFQQTECALNIDFKCKPTPLKVFQEIIRIEKKQERNVLFSIICPTHNRHLSIRRCIDSVMKQIYNNYELLICSDGDDLQVKNIIDSYSDNRIKYYYVEESNDCGATPRNHLANKCNGEYIIYLDDDNLLYSNCLEVLNSNISKNMGMIIFKTFNCLVNRIIPVTNEIKHGNIDSLSVCIKRNVILKNTWKTIYEHDLLFIKDCEKTINEENLVIKYIDDVLGEHLQAIEYFV